MTNLKILLLLIVVAVIAGIAGYATRLSTNPDIQSEASVEQTSNERVSTGEPQLTQSKPLWYWEFTDLAGKQRLLSEWQGPFLVVNFWATWCPPCLKEIPAFVELQNRFGEDQVQFLGIAYDYLDEVQKFLEKTPVNYPVLLGGDDVAIFMRELGNKIGGLPFTAVIDQDGKVVASHQGEWHQEDAAGALQALLNQRAPNATQ